MELLYDGFISSLEINDFPFEKTPSEIIKWSQIALLFSLKVKYIRSLFFSIFSMPWLYLIILSFNLPFKNSTNLDLLRVVYLQSSELKSEIFRSHIFFSGLIV